MNDYTTSIKSLRDMEPVFAFRRKGLSDFCTCDEERYNELAQKQNIFEVRVFYAAPVATSDMVNKAFADGKAEGHGDATAEASVVIGELRARVAELEAERAERERRHEERNRNGLDCALSLNNLRNAVNELRRAEYSEEPGDVRIGRLAHAWATVNEMLDSVDGTVEKPDPAPIETAVLRANGFNVDHPARHLELVSHNGNVKE